VAALPLLLQAGPAEAAPADPYAERFEQARRLEAEGRFGDAADALEPLTLEYPDDYTLSLQLGWLYYRDRDLERAESSYRRAVEVSNGAQAARLGLAWTLLELGEVDDAEALFRQLLAESPDLALARTGLSRIQRDHRIHTDARFAYITHSGHAFRGSGWAITAGLEIPFARQWVTTGHFRFTHLDNASPASSTAGSTPALAATGPGGGGGGGPGGGGGSGGPGRPGGGNGGGFAGTGAGVGDYGQEEVYVSSGIRRPGWGLLGHFAYVHDQGEFMDDLFALGMSGRISQAGDLSLEASVTLYPDDPFVRVSPSWRIDLGHGFHIRPGASLQVVQDAEVLGNGFVEAGWEGRRGALWVGGKGGPERRPTYLLLPLVFNLNDDIRWGVWAGAALRLGDDARLGAVYEYQELEYPVNGDLQTSGMHTISIAATLIF
jgi:tetratricopeptide (TPR) repeat protein